MKKGDLVQSIGNYVWENDTSVKPGIVVDHLSNGNLAIILDCDSKNDILVLTSRGVVGWVDKRGLHEIR